MGDDGVRKAAVWAEGEPGEDEAGERGGEPAVVQSGEGCGAERHRETGPEERAAGAEPFEEVRAEEELLDQRDGDCGAEDPRHDPNREGARAETGEGCLERIRSGRRGCQYPGDPDEAARGERGGVGAPAESKDQPAEGPESRRHGDEP